MVELLSALKYTIPAVIVFITAYTLLKEYFSQEMKKRHVSMIEAKQKVSMPLKIQAYERIILLLERISPRNLIVRVHDHKMTASQFHGKLTRAVREEFDHNLSQQLYVSSKAWEMIKNAKEETIQHINSCAGQLNENATSTDLSAKILEKGFEKTATKRALEYLKAEARKSFL